MIEKPSQIGYDKSIIDTKERRMVKMNELISQMVIEERLLKAIEVARILNVSRAFAYRLMQQGKIRTVAIAKTRRVRLGDLYSFIEDSLVPPCNQMSAK